MYKLYEEDEKLGGGWRIQKGNPQRGTLSNLYRARRHLDISTFSPWIYVQTFCFTDIPMVSSFIPRVWTRMGVKYFVGCALKMQWQSIRSFQWIKIIVSWSIILNFLTSKYLFPIDDDKRQKIYDIIRKTIMRKIL